MKKKLLIITIKVICFLIDAVLKLLIPKNVDEKKNSFYKWYLIRKSNDIQKKFLKTANHPSTVQYDPKNDNFYCAYPEPIMLRTDLTNKYYKTPYLTKHINDGSLFIELLNIKKKNVIIDIGSCFGEISIFLGNKLPNSKIISVEGSKINSEIQKHNIIANNIDNIILEENIIADKKEYFISNNKGSENFIREDAENNFDKKKSISLSDLIQKHKIDIIDFIKIDIEGSAPYLSNDLINLNDNDKIKNVMIGFEKNSYNSYSKIIESFKKNLFPYTLDYGNKKFTFIEYDKLIDTLKDGLPKIYTQKNKWAIDILFSSQKNL